MPTIETLMPILGLTFIAPSTQWLKQFEAVKINPLWVATILSFACAIGLSLVTGNEIDVQGIGGLWELSLRTAEGLGTAVLAHRVVVKRGK